MDRNHSIDRRHPSIGYPIDDNEIHAVHFRSATHIVLTSITLGRNCQMTYG